jgi:prepilin-type N-terminal cleavage/methylation domain-containing protein
MKKNYKRGLALRNSKGFTLIELLVVIAIIGILASIILASLATARGKGSDAKAEEQLGNMRAQAQLYTGTGAAVGTAAAVIACPTTGTNLFGDTASTNSLASLFGGITTSYCYSTLGQPSAGAAWAVVVGLNTGSWCVDSTGQSKAETATVTTAATAQTDISGGACL